MALTEPGTELSFEDTATVVFEPNAQRGTVLSITVQRVRQGDIAHFSGFVLDEQVKRSTPYYVDVRVLNVGEGDVGGLPVPLWGVDQDNTLLQASTFTTDFRRCRSRPLPGKSGPDASTRTCLAYLAPDGATLEAVSFRPSDDVEPVEWRGEVADAGRPKGRRGNRGRERWPGRPGGRAGTMEA